MPLGFGSHTSCTRFTIFLDKFMESGPGIIAADEVHCLILTGMSREDVVVLVVENSELVLNMASGAHLSFLYCFICLSFIDY